jgi:hypothetical protein
LHQPVSVRLKPLKIIATCFAALCLAGGSMEARDEGASADDMALREMLEGTEGRRAEWGSIPELVVLTSVMDFTGPDMTPGYISTGEIVAEGDVERMVEDFTAALGALTGGTFPAFSAVHVEAVPQGQRVRMFRRGQVVVGRFHGVRERSGTLGFGGRTTREGAITAGAVVLDSEFYRESEQRGQLRMHELGHALGYNHVASRRSVMNPRVGAGLTDFDRIAIEIAFLKRLRPFQPAMPEQLARRQN